MSTKTWAVATYDDLELHVRTRAANDAVLEYEVREIVGECTLCGERVMLFVHKDNRSEGNETSVVDDGLLLVAGIIKFDGSSHNYFANYIHAGSREEMTRIGVLFDRLYDIALACMPQNERFLARANPKEV